MINTCVTMQVYHLLWLYSCIVLNTVIDNIYIGDKADLYDSKFKY